MFAAAEVGRYGRALEEILRRRRNGAEYDGTKLERATPLVDEDPETFPHQSWEETALHGYLARVNKRHGNRLLSDNLLHTAGERRRKKIAKLYEMGL